jgi:hypothetical protein
MAAHVNLISHNTAESAWGYALIERSPLSSKFGGLSLALDHSFKSLLKSILPQRRWLIEKQFNATLNYIGRRRGISNSGFVEHNYGRLFPKMSFQDISKVQNEALSQTYKDYEMVLEGVILQIIMNQTEAERYCYAAHPYGYVYSKDHKLFGSEWKTNDYNGEAIDPFMTYYYDNKNKQDLLQTVRIALGKDFVKYPSRVKIKAISPLMQDEEAMRLVRLMIDEMVRQSRKVL